MGNSWNSTDESRLAFCSALRISEEVWAKAEMPWDSLLAIGQDHLDEIQSLTESASMYANLVQAIEGVHSVRWRVKDVNHLLAKIVRKRAEGREAYTSISLENYFDVVTDLVGIRALHLFKSDFYGIHKRIFPLFTDKEKPVANVRVGDPEEFSEDCRSLGLDVRIHPAGYRSIHYVKTVRPIKRELHFEIQVRTVFEEGWSEIDHRVRYPNFSDDPLVIYASKILNRLSGMADEMSTYAQQLVSSLADQAQQINNSKHERNDALRRLDLLVQELEGAKEGVATKEETIRGLKQELVALKSAVSRDQSLLALSGLGAGNELASQLHSMRENVNPSIRDLIVGQSSMDRLSLEANALANAMGAVRYSDKTKK